MYWRVRGLRVELNREWLVGLQGRCRGSGFAIEFQSRKLQDLHANPKVLCSFEDILILCMYRQTPLAAFLQLPEPQEPSTHLWVGVCVAKQTTPSGSPNGGILPLK